MLTLEPVKIRGEKSEGMICAAEELGIDDLYPECTGHDIVDMGDGDENVGKPLREVLSLNDTVLHIDNHAITHRADLFSHFGFARECVAIGIASWKSSPKINDINFANAPLPFKIHVDSPALVPRYSGCMIEIDGIGETPDWMKRKLEATGWRSINLPIDITNYVIMEMGMPMHSFDADDLVGDVHMRTSKKGETVVTLDGVERELPDGALVICDDDGIFDLLGIMGGLRSSTKDTTKRIYLHGAILDAATIRRGIIATGHRTDGSTVYEKGVPACFSEPGLKRAVSLFLELVPGARVVSELESWGDNGKAVPIDLFVERVNKMLGVEIEQKRMVQILSDLEFEVQDKGKGVLSVTPPLHRLGDITGAHDLTEEVGRIYGYNNIENALPSASIEPPVRDQRIHKIRDRLVDQGFVELLPLSLIGPDLLKKANIFTDDCTEIENAIGNETSIMTPSTLPALLEHAGKNMLEVDSLLRSFHVSTVFADSQDSHIELGGLIALRSSVDLKNDPFLLLKQEITSALSKAGYAVSIDLCDAIPSYAHSGRCADILLDKKVIGTIFEVHPDVCKRFDLPARAAGITINITQLFATEPTEIVYRDIPDYPAVCYDTTVPMAHSKSVGKLLKKIRESSKLLESVEVADLYGKESGEYKLTLRCTYRSSEKTLTEEEAKKEFASVEKLL